MLKETPKGIQLTIKVIPKSSFNKVIGWENDMLKVRIKAAPKEGEANEALIEFLSKSLKIPKSKISITHGHTSRIKRICIDSSKDFIEKALKDFQ